MSLTNKYNVASCAIRSFDSGEPSVAIAHGGAGLGKFAPTAEPGNTITPAGPSTPGL